MQHQDFPHRFEVGCDLLPALPDTMMFFRVDDVLHAAKAQGYSVSLTTVNPVPCSGFQPSLERVLNGSLKLALGIHQLASCLCGHLEQQIALGPISKPNGLLRSPSDRRCRTQIPLTFRI